jgi:hypothetical protein
VQVAGANLGELTACVTACHNQAVTLKPAEDCIAQLFRGDNLILAEESKSTLLI